jgi:hypothetical protein
MTMTNISESSGVSGESPTPNQSPSFFFTSIALPASVVARSLWKCVTYNSNFAQRMRQRALQFSAQFLRSDLKLPTHAPNHRSQARPFVCKSTPDTSSAPNNTRKILQPTLHPALIQFIFP